MNSKNRIAKFFMLLPILPMLAACAGGTPSAVTTEAAATTAEAVTTAEPVVPVPTVELTKKDSLVKLKTGSDSVRDPFILHYNGKYYMYSTGWVVRQTRSDNLTSRFTAGVECVKTPSDCAGDKWAPEVYEINGKFYMIATYKSSKTGHRGCAVFVSDEPGKGFTIISDGHVTPSDWDSIDGTLYFDEDGQPWMIFVHEWTSTDDGVGRMACAKMSDDLTHFISEPVELFRATDAPWARYTITDGCFMYRTKGGKLLMLWSNLDAGGYCVGVAESETGLVTGPWIQHEEPLYSKTYTEEYDGGHGMIFTDGSGYMWMVIHSPNGGISAGRVETPILVPLKEENDNLVWDTLDRGY
jgi:arabinan endo-1,5-alpha-L-arabinosidase